MLHEKKYFPLKVFKNCMPRNSILCSYAYAKYCSMVANIYEMKLLNLVSHIHNCIVNRIAQQQCTSPKL